MRKTTPRVLKDNRDHNFRILNPKKVRMSWRRRWRYFYLKFFNLRGKPRAIALGWAIGVFAGCFPLFGLQMMFAIILATLFKGHRLAAIAGTWISNPITYVPIFVFNFKLGKFLLGWHDLDGLDVDFHSVREIMELGYTVISALFLGCFVVGLIASCSVYFLSFWLINRLNRRSLP
jgi:uncharacterized protein (DUF2062 family)